MTGRWRPGRSWGTTLVLQVGPEPTRPDDQLIGYVRRIPGIDAEKLASDVCAAVNGEPGPAELQLWRFGSLLCGRHDPEHPAASWVIAMDRPEDAQRIVDALTGTVE